MKLLLTVCEYSKALNTSMNKKDRNTCLPGAYFLVKEDIQLGTNIILCYVSILYIHIVCTYYIKYHVYILYENIWHIRKWYGQKKNRLGEMGSEIQTREQIVVLNKVDSLGFTEREKNGKK